MSDLSKKDFKSIMKSKFDNQDGLDEMQQDPNNYKWGTIYFNSNDPRFILPKRNPYMGLTVNLAHPYAYLILIGFVAFVLLLTRIGAPHSHFPKIF
jgi:uncharacterized membrane protein